MKPSKKQKTKTGRAGSEAAPRTRTKPSSRASKQPNAAAAAKASEEKDDNWGGADTGILKNNNPKKRKINIFPTGNDAIPFSFGGLSNVCFYFYFMIYFFSYIYALCFG